MTNTRKPRAYMTKELFEEIITAMHAGIPLGKWLESKANNPEIPARSEIMQFINADNGFKTIYTHAREDCADALAEQVVSEADNLIVDPARSSNRMKARQWLASKMKPKVYGDKLDVDIKGTLDVGAAILAARQRARLEPLTIDNEVDPFS